MLDTLALFPLLLACQLHHSFRCLFAIIQKNKDLKGMWGWQDWLLINNLQPTHYQQVRLVKGKHLHSMLLRKHFFFWSPSSSSCKRSGIFWYQEIVYFLHNKRMYLFCTQIDAMKSPQLYNLVLSVWRVLYGSFMSFHRMHMSGISNKQIHFWVHYYRIADTVITSKSVGKFIH